MNKKTLIIIIIIIVIFLALAVKFRHDSDNRLTPNNIPSPQANSLQSLLHLYPEELMSGPQGNVNISVMIDTQKTDINSVKFELFYDPRSLKFIDIQPVGIFKDAQVTLKNIHDRGGKCCTESGKITYGLSVDPQVLKNHMSQNTPLATISFIALKKAWNTEVRFLNASINSQDIPDVVYKPGFNSIINFTN